MNPAFAILDWSGFAAGLESRAAWQDWARAPVLPEGDAIAPLAEMPAMQRRRVEKLGRMALQVAYWCQSAANAGCPLVFASRHGDLSRTYAMLQELARGQPLSPTHFGLSTHNAIAAQYGIARSLPANYLAVSAGACTGEAALIEALGLLTDGAAEVLVVNYDGLVPDEYSQYCDEPACDYAWAWRVGLASARAPTDAPSFSLNVAAAEDLPGAPSALPHGLDLLRFILTDETKLLYRVRSQQWCWQRHA
jgi:hypothetical protein